MKKIVVMLITVVMTLSLAACAGKNENEESTESKLSIVTTIFPYYDFVRQVAGDKVDLTMLVSAGKDSHSFEPSPQDMITIQNADVFIYNGGEMESWVSQVLDAVESDTLKTSCMMDYVTAYEEETVEGMEEEQDSEEEEAKDEEEETEYDEHIWTSPKNAQIIVTQIAEELSKADPENEAYYKENAASYVEELVQLDEEIKDVVDNAARNTIILGDKFPFRYMVEEYGLDYYAAFPGCSTETEPSADTIAFLITKVKEEQIPVVYYTEQSTGKIADTISEATGAKTVVLQSCHTVSSEQFESGVTYLELMEQNVAALKEGLN